jgi:hypothetical protein
MLNKKFVLVILGLVIALLGVFCFLMDLGRGLNEAKNAEDEITI